MPKYTIKVDSTKCIAAASCIGVAMNTFTLNDQNVAQVINEEGDNPELIVLAAQSCPTSAITLIDTQTGEQVWPKE